MVAALRRARRWCCADWALAAPPGERDAWRAPGPTQVRLGESATVRLSLTNDGVRDAAGAGPRRLGAVGRGGRAVRARVDRRPRQSVTVRRPR